MTRLSLYILLFHPKTGARHAKKVNGFINRWRKKNNIKIIPYSLRDGNGMEHRK
jgi:hypothetical protein